MNKQNLKTLIWNMIKNHNGIRNVMRFTSIPKIEHENVAEHTFMVIYLSSVISYLFAKNGDVINREKVLDIALFHDFEEIKLGDIITPVKKQMKETYKIMQTEALNSLFPFDKSFPDLKEYMISCVDYDKKSLEGKIVKLADIIAGVIYTIKEISLGNKNMIPMKKQYMKYLREFTLNFKKGKIFYDVLKENSFNTI